MKKSISKEEKDNYINNNTNEVVNNKSFFIKFKERYLDYDKKEFIKLFNLHFNQVIKNKWFLISIAFVCLSPLFILLPLVVATDFYSLSYLYALIIVFVSIIFIFYFVYKLFVVNQTNFIDTLVITKSFNKRLVYFVRVLLIYLLLIGYSFVQSIISTIIVAASSWSPLTLNVWLITFFGQLIITSLFIPLFLITSIKTSSSLFVIINLLTIAIVFLTSIIGNALMIDVTKNNSLTYDVNNNVNYQVVQNKDNPNDKRIGITRNWSSKVNNNTDIENSLNYVDNNIQALPGVWIMSPLQLMFANNNVYKNDYDFLKKHSSNNYQFSLTKLVLVNNIENTKYFNDSNKYVTYRVGDRNLYNLDTTSLQNEIINNLKLIYSELELSKKDNSYFSLLNKKLDVFIWDDTLNLSFEDKNIITSLLGLKKYSTLYYLYYDFEYFFKNIPYLFDEITQTFSKDFSDLFYFLMSSYTVKTNVNEMKYFDTFLGDDKLEFPTLKELNELEKPNDIDVNFIKKYLISFNNGKFYVLNSNGIYNEEINMNNIDPTIVDDKSWEQYVDLYSTNLKSLINLYETIKNNSLSAYNYEFNDNYYNNYKFYGLYELKQKPWFDFSSTMVALFLIIPLLSIPFISNLYHNKNIK